MLTHSHFLWEDSFCLDSEEQCRRRGVGFGGLFCFVLYLLLGYPNFSLIEEKGPPPFLACDLDYLHGGIWAIYSLYMA